MADSTIFWMTAKRDGRCSECKDDINVGDRIVYDSESFKAYCSSDGQEILGDDPHEERKQAEEIKKQHRQKKS